MYQFWNFGKKIVGIGRNYALHAKGLFFLKNPKGTQNHFAIKFAEIFHFRAE
jgi:hypothetical protein